MEKATEIFCENLKRYVIGKRLINVVNKKFVYIERCEGETISELRMIQESSLGITSSQAPRKNRTFII